MSIQLEKADIRECCGSTYFQRGLGYFNEGRVVDLDVLRAPDGKVVHIQSAVRGSGGRVYRQEIELWEDEFGREVDGTCSCPLQFNCKHVVAALLEYLEQAPPSLPEPVTGPEDWVGRLRQAAGPPRQAEPFPGEEAVIYHLEDDSAPDGTPAARVIPTHVPLRGDGTYGAPRPFPLTRLQQIRGSPTLEGVDREIADLLGISDPFAGDWGPFRLTGAAGMAALMRMVQTGRCYRDTEQGLPLSAGPPRPLETAWQEEAEGFALVVDTQPGSDRLLPLEPPAYLDRTRNTCGIVEIQGGGEALRTLLMAPPVPAGAASELSERLVAEVPDLAITTPAPVEVEEVQESAPVPCLTLTGRSLGEGERVHFARIDFEYAGHTVAPLPLDERTTRRGGGRVVRIHRDLGAEGEAVNRLLEAGLVVADDRVQDDPSRPLLWMQPGDVQASARGWHHFLEETVGALEEAGWRVMTEPDFRLGFVEPDRWQVEVDESDHDWFDVGLGIQVGGQRLDLLPLLQPLVAELGRPEDLLERGEELYLRLPDSQWLRLPPEAVYPVVQTLFELFDRPLDESGRMQLSATEALRLGELEAGRGKDLEWRGGKRLRKMVRGLREAGGVKPVKPPRALAADLRGYQQQGLEWLQFLRAHSLGGILADDMGLGKTIQALAHLLLERQRGRLDRPCLVVAPTSLMGNWRSEAERFAPRLSVLTLHGPERKQWFDRIGEYDLVLTTYPLLPRDAEALQAQSFHTVILDEAQTIKNPRAKAAQVARTLEARHRLCLTGTPMENHLGELWSLFHFLMPGFLGEQERFNRLFRTPIERHGDDAQRNLLQHRVRPFLLRRTKEQVAAELPEKTELVQTVALADPQADLYESVRLAMAKRVRDALAHKGLARSQVTVLDALLKLRQICCDPRLVKLERARRVSRSAKLEALMQMLPEMVEEGRRILVFSQFTTMLGLIEAELDKAGIGYSKLTGRTKKRDAAIERFRSGEVPVFLISLKAGGVGLNLTEADTVIHYDPWWNPAAENQATDRAHRIGQDKAVFVYKLVTEDTVEERILALQQKKAALADAMYRQGEGEQSGPRFTEADLEALLRPLG